MKSIVISCHVLGVILLIIAITASIKAANFTTAEGWIWPAALLAALSSEIVLLLKVLNIGANQ